MPNNKENYCPFCKEKINEGAVKCRYCQSLLTEVSASSKTERLAELVIKAVGTIPIMITILLVIAAYFGLKTLSDAQDYAKKAKESYESIEKQYRVNFILIQHNIESKLNVLLNDLDVDSKATKANDIRQELRQIFDAINKTYKTEDLEKIQSYKLTEGLLAYNDGDYDKAHEIILQANDTPNKFRLLGAVANQKGYREEVANNMNEAKKYYRVAYINFNKAGKMIAKDECKLLCKNKANLAAMASNIGDFDEAEVIFKGLIKDDPNQPIHYWNLARLYSQWGKLDLSIKTLEQGLKGLVETRNISRDELINDPAFKNLRSSEKDDIKKRFEAILEKLP